MYIYILLRRNVYIFFTWKIIWTIHLHFGVLPCPFQKRGFQKSILTRYDFSGFWMSTGIGLGKESSSIQIQSSMRTWIPAVNFQVVFGLLRFARIIQMTYVVGYPDKLQIQPSLVGKQIMSLSGTIILENHYWYYCFSKNGLTYHWVVHPRRFWRTFFPQGYNSENSHHLPNMSSLCQKRSKYLANLPRPVSN